MEHTGTIVVNAMAAERWSFTALLLTRGRIGPAGTTLRVTEGDSGDAHALPTTEIDPRWRRFDAGEESFSWAKVLVEGLTPATDYSLDVVTTAGEVCASARCTTLDESTSTVFNAVVGSCFEASTGTTVDRWGDAYDRVVAALPAGPVQQCWLGDQVYVDVPWHAGFTYRDPRSTVARSYLETWGVSSGARAESRRFAYSLRSGANWFLSDDHEFWNGYPANSWLTMFLPSLARLPRLAMRGLGGAHEPHPATEGRWGRAAGEAYAALQTTLDFADFGSALQPPQVQRIDYDGHRVLLVDTRWQRTILRQREGSGFMDDDALDELVDLLDTDQLVTLMLSKPVVGYPPKGAKRRFGEPGPEHYERQYSELLAAIDDRARLARPTVVVGGDVHFHAVRTAADDHVLEVVSSAMSMLDPKGPLVTPIRKLKRLIGRYTRRRSVNPLTFPRFNPDGSWEPSTGTAFLGRGADGTEHTPLQSAATSISIDVADPAAPALSYRCVPLDPKLEEELADRLDMRFAWTAATGWERV